MYKSKKVPNFLLLTFIVCGSVLCTAKSEYAVATATSSIYTAYNLWYEKPKVMYSINYKKGRMIPAGSQVRNIELKEGRKARISFQLMDDEQEYTIHFQKKFHPGLTIHDIHDRLFTSTSLDQAVRRMNELEKECIEKGVIKPNISKETVLIAYGYPPEHRTQSIDLDLWYYWIHRFGQRELRFDDKGKTLNNLP